MDDAADQRPERLADGHTDRRVGGSTDVTAADVDDGAVHDPADALVGDVPADELADEPADEPADELADELAEDPPDDSADEIGEEVGGGATERPTTGHPAVDEVLRSLDRLEEQPVEEHVRAFERAHEELRRALADAHDPGE
jgi:hypothetical protein